MTHQPQSFKARLELDGELVDLQIWLEGTTWYLAMVQEPKRTLQNVSNYSHRILAQKEIASSLGVDGELDAKEYALRRLSGHYGGVPPLEWKQATVVTAEKLERGKQICEDVLRAIAGSTFTCEWMQDPASAVTPREYPCVLLAPGRNPIHVNLISRSQLAQLADGDEGLRLQIYQMLKAAVRA